MPVRFGEVLLDLDRMVVERDGEEVPVEPQVFEVLAYLVRNRERLVPRTELLDEIWGDRFVSDSALSTRIKLARQAIGDNGRDQRLIRTVHGRGFRFVGEVVGDDSIATSGEEEPVGSAADGTLRWTPGDLPHTVVALLRSGRGATVELVGSCGPARTELFDEVLDSAAGAGFVVGRGDVGELRPLSGILGALDEWVQRRPQLLEAIPAGCATELRAVLEGDAPSSWQRLTLATRELLVAAGRSGGAVLGIDNFHLVDAASAELLTHLTRSISRVPVTLVVTHRDGFRVGAHTHTVHVEGEPGDVAERIPATVRPALARVAVIGEALVEAEIAAAAGLDRSAARRLVEVALASGAMSSDGPGYRFVDADLVCALADEVPGPEQADICRAAAAELTDAEAPAARIADLLLRAGDPEAAAPHLLAAARDAAGLQMHGHVLQFTEDTMSMKDPAIRFAMLELRADAAAALGLPEAVGWYRAAIREASSDDVSWLRARLARACIMASDIDGALDALDGVTLSGQPTDGGILLVSGMVAYLTGDLQRAEQLAEQARPFALAPGAPSMMLDVITLQGMVAHSRGEWFGRLRRELRFLSDTRVLASTVFDSHVCVAQYLLYGPSEHAEVVQLADELRVTAEEQGAWPAAGFALTLAGEAMFLSGDLQGARDALERSVDLHRQIGADTGLAHALQRLADVELALGDRAAAERLCRRALPLARWSPLAAHLLQRLYGTLIAAAPDPATAAATVDEAAEVVDGPTACQFCQVVIAVPAATALASAGRIEEAQSYLEDAERCAARWEGPAWAAAVDEARATIARIEGRERDAQELFARAAAGFEAAGQPVDRARCLEAVAG